MNNKIALNLCIADVNVLESFFDNWMTGGAETREAFRRDVTKLLVAVREHEQDRCASIAEERSRHSPLPPGDSDRGWKMAARRIADLIRGPKER